MKTYINFWLLCLMLLSLPTVETHAQMFYFKQLFDSFKYTYGKKQTQKTFTPNDKLYNHQWKLTVDGKLVSSNSDADCLHVGKDAEKSQLIRLETTPPFKDVDLVRVSTDIAKGRKGRGYKVSMNLGSDNNNYGDTRNLTKDKDNLNNNLSIFYITEGNIKSGTLKVEMKGEKYEDGALYLFYIEVASVLSDQQKLRTQHIKLGDTYSYQVQRTFASTHWNTICLPFDVSKEALAEAMGKNCALRKFNKEVESNVLKFDKTDTIKAGVPYLIKPVREVANPIFSNVTYVKNIEPKAIEDANGQFAFVGTFDPVKLSVDGSDLFLLSNGNLAKPKSDKVSEMYGMRAYFKINEQNSTSAKQITYAIDCDSETVTGIQSPVYPSTSSQHIYNLQGVDVGTDLHHLPAGVYVMGGKKIMKR